MRCSPLDFAKPIHHSGYRLSLLRCLHRKCIGELRLRCMSGQNRQAVSQSVAAMSDQRYDRLAGEVVAGKERADYGWNGHTPDWKAEEYGVVAGDIGDRPFKRRFIATAALLLRLLHRLEIVFRVRLFRYDLEQVGSQRPACKFRGNPPPDSEMISPPNSEK